MNRMVSMRVLFAVFLMLSFTWTVNASDEASGSLRKCKGEVLLERNGTVIKALEGAPVYSRDAVRTGADGSVGIIFKDHSRNKPWAKFPPGIKGVCLQAGHQTIFHGQQTGQRRRLLCLRKNDQAVPGGRRP